MIRLGKRMDLREKIDAIRHGPSANKQLPSRNRVLLSVARPSIRNQKEGRLMEPSSRTPSHPNLARNFTLQRPRSAPNVFCKESSFATARFRNRYRGGICWKLCGPAARRPEKASQCDEFAKAFTVMSKPSRNLLTCTSAFGWRKERDAQASASTEQSEGANEELLLFFFQLDLMTRVQRALNLDQYEAAQQLRERLLEVEKELLRITETKLGLASSKDEAQDKAITILRLRNDLQQAIEAEDYVGAAELRDKISRLEAESLAAAARALAYQNVQYLFRLGQKVVHQKFGYRGVVCGMDPLCAESESWGLSAGVQELSRGKNQPFYQVLVDARAQPNLLVSYVAEENLIPLKEPDKDFEHPYVSFLFYGMDSAGDFIPIKQLREKYNQPRHELPWGQEDGSSDDSKP